MTRAESRELERAKVRAALHALPADAVAAVVTAPVPVPPRYEIPPARPQSMGRPAGTPHGLPPRDDHSWMTTDKARGPLVRVDSLTIAGPDVPPAACRFLFPRDTGPDLVGEVHRIGVGSVYIRQITASPAARLFTDDYGCIAAGSMVYRLP